MSYPGNPPPYPGPPQNVQILQLQPVPDNHRVHTVVASRSLGPEPVLVVCESCNYQIITNTDVRPSIKTHIWAVCLFLLGCWPCAWLPYCTPACMNVSHHCPNCKAYIGNYRH